MFRQFKRLSIFLGLIAFLAACTQDLTPLPNKPPTAQDQSFNLAAGKKLVITLSATDPDNDELSYSFDQQSLTGVTVQKTNDFATSHKVSYTAPANAKEGDTDSFSFSAQDPSGETATATITINLKSADFVNKPPVAESQTLSVSAGQTLEIVLKASDPEGDALDYTVDAKSEAGVSLVKFNNFATNHKLSYTAPANAKEGDQDNFSFTVTDTSGATATASISLTVGSGSGTGPEAVDDSFSALINTPLLLGSASLAGPAVKVADSLLSNDKNTTSNTQVVAQDKTTAQGGQLSITVDGSVIYTPKTGFAGQDSFSYQITDSSQSPTKTEATVTITVEEVNTDVAGTQQIIYLKPGAASGADGSSSKPYKSLLDAELNSKVGDVIVLQPGRYAPAGIHSIILKNDQKILGQEADVVINGKKVLDKNTTTGTVLNRSEDNNFSLVLLDKSDNYNIKVLRQSDNVTIKGLTIDRSNGAGKTGDPNNSITTGGAGIVGADVLKGTITIEDVKILYPGGFGITFAESSGCPHPNCDANVEDPTDGYTLGTTYNLVIRNVLIESPRNSAIAANDNTSVIIDNVTVNNAIRLAEKELDPINKGTEGRIIAIESEYDTTVSVTNTTVNSSDAGVKAFYFFSNNDFGRNPDDAVMNVNISNNHANFTTNASNDLNADGNVDDTVAYDIRVFDNDPDPVVGSSTVVIKGSSQYSHADSPCAFEGLAGSCSAIGGTATF